MHAITGATGLLGSHIAEQLCASGHRVRALARPQSDPSFLRQLDVEIIAGDLTDPKTAVQLVRDAEIVYHCAAKTGNWANWSEHVDGTIKLTRNIVEACLGNEQVKRLLHVSSIAVYGHPHFSRGEAIDEDSPLGQRLWLWDFYTRAKIEAERIVQRLESRATRIRPTWMYGPRDSANLPKLLKSARQGGLWIINSGDNLLNMLSAAEVAEAAIRAATCPTAGGQAYNICTTGELTQQQMLELACELTDRPPVQRHVPHFLVHALGFGCELFGRLVGKRNPPFITRHGMSVFLRPTCYSFKKARQQLGWRPHGETREQLARAIQLLIADSASAGVEP